MIKPSDIELPSASQHKRETIEETIAQKYFSLNFEERKDVHRLFKNPDTLPELRAKLEKIVYKMLPPTADEFLNPANGWIPQKLSESLWSHVREDFKNIIDGGEKNYFQIALYGGTRTGKCEKKGTEVLMHDLSIKKIENIQIGDKVMGLNGECRTVLALHNGIADLYEIKQNKAETYYVNEDHILVLQYTNRGLRKERNNSPDKNSGKIIEISVKDYLKLSKKKKHLLKGIKSKLHFNENPVKIDPYLLACWCGKGSSHEFSITTEDKEIRDYIYESAKNLKLEVSERQKENNKATNYLIKGTKRGINHNNILLRNLQNYNLQNNKHIPKEYIKNSEKVRLEFLAGIIDTNGHLMKKGDCASGYEIIFKSDTLTKDVCLLSRSLGFRVVTKKCKKTIKSRNFSVIYNRIWISGDISKIPVKLERKKYNKKTIRVNPLRTGIKVNKVEKEEYYGFMVDGDGIYLSPELTIKHNSYLTRLLILYTIVFIHHLREPAVFYNLSAVTNLAMYLISFDFDKTKQLYLDYVYKWMEAAPRYTRIHFKDKVRGEQEKHGCRKIVYSQAALVGKITLASNLQILLGNDNPNEIIGSDLLSVYISEIAYFIEEMGASEDDIYTLYTNAYTRIKATVGNKYLAHVLLDSSANHADSKIEKHILKKLSKSPDTYFTWRSQWDAQKDKVAPRYFEGLRELEAKGVKPSRIKTELLKRGLVFRVITGNGNIPAKIVTDPSQIKNVPRDLIDYVPIDVKDSYELNLIKNIKDIGGKPTSNESKFIQDVAIIHNMFSNEDLVNIDGGVIIDSAEDPTELIWKGLHTKFFNQSFERFNLIRAPKEPRFIGCDTSFSNKGDAYGFSCLHKEMCKEVQSVIYVVDFSFVFLPGKNGINLSAVEELILDLRRIGNMSINSVAGDKHYIANIKQNIQDRHGVKVISQSVDTDLEPYQYLFSCLLQQKIKSGKNIFLKNNLQCLERVVNDKGKEKIDHPKGKTNHIYNGDFHNSSCGLNEKDCSDSLTQALWSAFKDEFSPATIYEEENLRLYGGQEHQKPYIEDAFRKLHGLSSIQISTNKKEQNNSFSLQRT